MHEITTPFRIDLHFESIIDLLKDYCSIEPRDDPRRVQEKVTGKLLTLDPALQPTLPVFLSLYYMLRSDLRRACRKAGFKFVALDLGGLQSGGISLPLATV